MEDINYLKKKMAEVLWFQINSIVLNSSSVQTCARLLQEMNLVDHVSAHNFPVDIKELLKTLSAEHSGDEHPCHKLREMAAQFRL